MIARDIIVAQPGLVVEPKSCAAWLGIWLIAPNQRAIVASGACFAPSIPSVLEHGFAVLNPRATCEFAWRLFAFAVELCQTFVRFVTAFAAGFIVNHARPPHLDLVARWQYAHALIVAAMPVTARQLAQLSFAIVALLLFPFPSIRDGDETVLHFHLASAADHFPNVRHRKWCYC